MAAIVARYRTAGTLSGLQKQGANVARKVTVPKQMPLSVTPILIHQLLGARPRRRPNTVW